MKSSRLLLGSIAVNFTLLVVFALRPALLPRKFRAVSTDAPTLLSGQNARARSATQLPGASPQFPPAAATAGFWSTLDSGDLRTFVRNLQAAGFSPAMVREMASVRIHAVVKARVQAEARQAGAAPFWKPLPVTDGSDGARGFYSDSWRLFAEVIPPELRETRPARPRPLGELPPSKIETIARIDRDYEELRQKLPDTRQGVELAEDREKRALLQRARRADIVAALTPEELEIYDLSRWYLTNRVAEALNRMDGTEDEFVKIFRTYRPFAEALDPWVRTPDSPRQRAEAEKQIAEQLKVALGEARYAEYLRSSDREFQDLARIVERQDLPAEKAIQAFDLRAGALAESRRIYDDPNQNVAQKRAALQALAGEVEPRIVALLGPTEAERYLEMNGWLRQIARGGTVTLGANGEINSWLFLPKESAPPSGTNLPP